MRSFLGKLAPLLLAMLFAGCGSGAVEPVSTSVTVSSETTDAQSSSEADGEQDAADPAAEEMPAAEVPEDPAAAAGLEDGAAVMEDLAEFARQYGIESIDDLSKDDLRMLLYIYSLEKTPKRDAWPFTYEIPENWVEATTQSSEYKVFYTEAGRENDLSPDNISVEMGTNLYGPDELTEFKNAIMQQLSSQMDNVKEFDGVGITSENGYSVLRFTLREEERTTRMYYIPADHRHVLVHLTSFTGEEAGVDAAEFIVNSFAWSE